jgi:GTP cyclohydrolase I
VKVIRNSKKELLKHSKNILEAIQKCGKKILDKTFGDVEGYDDMVVEKNISVQVTVEHHMAPIVGTAHVA